MIAAYKMDQAKRDALIGKTIASIDVEDGASFGMSFRMTFTDGTSIYVESEGYEGIGITVEEQ